MKLDSRLLAYGLCAASLVLGSNVALAQMSGQGQGCTAMQMMRNQCGQSPQKKKEEKQEAKQPSQYPNATRQEPKIEPPSGKESDALNEGLNAVNSGDTATAQKDLQPIADSSTNVYAKAKALSGLALLKYNGGDTKGAIALQKQAIDLDSLPNDEYFPVLFALAQMYVADEDYQQALAVLDQWLQQSGKQSADAYALKGNVLYRLEKYSDAVDAINKAKSLTDQPKPDWDQILIASYFAMDKYDEAAKVAEAALAKDPNNAKLLMAVAQSYMNAQQYDKALPLLEKARASGQITDEATYINLAKVYYNMAVDGKDPKTNALKSAQVIEDGMGKGIVKPTSDNYKLLGDAYRLAGDEAKANAAYDKGGLPHVDNTHKGHKKKS
ncbi:MAG TPA: tetratricopeptide repeat protein [Rhodanobacteraceae bacterium]|nr:tetratricopeptide repeat protein [Rhodanobacteraceae bacterium]